MKNCIYIHGVGSSPAIDTSQEVIDLAGLDCSSLIGGPFTWEHKNDQPNQLVGKILDYKKIFSEKDCENEHHKYFWDKCGGPYLYIMGRLFDDKKDSSKEVAALFIDDAEHPNEHPMVGFSVEGSKIEKKGMIVIRSIARKITITNCPANKQCVAKIYPQEKTNKSDTSSIFKSDTSICIDLVKSEEIKKSLSAGSGMASPDTLSGGAALGKESLDKANNKVCLPKKEFVKEHENLVEILEHPSKKKLSSEAKEQKKELKEVKKNEELEKGWKENIAGGLALLASASPAHAASGHLHQYISSLNKVPGVKATSAFKALGGKSKNGYGSYSIKVGPYTIEGIHNSLGPGNNNHKMDLYGPKEDAKQDPKSLESAKYIYNHIQEKAPEILDMPSSAEVNKSEELEKTILEPVSPKKPGISVAGVNSRIYHALKQPGAKETFIKEHQHLFDPEKGYHLMLQLHKEGAIEAIKNAKEADEYNKRYSTPKIGGGKYREMARQSSQEKTKDISMAASEDINNPVLKNEDHKIDHEKMEENKEAAFSTEHVKIIFDKESCNEPNEWERFKLAHPTHVVIEDFHGTGNDVGYVICHESTVPEWLERMKERNITVYCIDYQGERYYPDEEGDEDEDLDKSEKPFHGYNKKRHARTGGLNAKFRAKYNREHGSHLKAPVTEKNPGGKRAARRRSFCARMKGVPGPTSKEGKLTPKGAALKRWRCSKNEHTDESLCKKERCWSGYEPTPGKKPYSKGSCRPIKKSEPFVHMGYHITETTHPKTPKGQKAFQLHHVESGKKDILFANSMKDAGNYVTNLTRKPKWFQEEKSEKLVRAEQDYNIWNKKEQFESFLKERLPNLAQKEIQAIGQALCLKKSIEAEKKLKKIMDEGQHSWMQKDEPHPLHSRTSIHNGREEVSKPGESKLTLAGLRHHLKNGSFSIFTAENPSAKKLDSKTNQLRNVELEHHLQKMGAIYHKVKGKYGNEENSYMVHHTKGVGPKELEHLAAKHGQESILHSTENKHQMKYVTGDNTGKHHPGEGHEFKPHASDYYSQLPGKKQSKFSANIDFGKLHKSEEQKHAFIMDTEEGPQEIHFHIDKSKLI